MSSSARPSFFARLWLAIVCFFRVVFDPGFAAQVLALRRPSRPPAAGPQSVAQHPTVPSIPSAIGALQLARSEQALHLLSLLQREGRLVDFCQEDLAGFSDVQIGAAARAVHDGCRKALREVFELTPV